MTDYNTDGLTIPNEIAAAYLIDNLHRAARLTQACRDATITRHRHDHAEIYAHAAAAKMARGR